MSKLILTPFTLEIDATKFENYEQNMIPKKGERVFIFTDGTSATDIANISVVKKQLGYVKI